LLSFMLKANYLLRNESHREQSLTVEETGWRGEPDRGERKAAEDGWRKKSAVEVTTHLRKTRADLKMHHDAVKLALEKVPGLINQEAGALKRLAKMKRRDEIRKSSKESNDKAQKKRDREVAKNERKKMEARERDLASSDSGPDDGSEGPIHSSDDMDDSEEEKAPPPPPVVEPNRRRRRSSASDQLAPPAQRAVAAPAARRPAAVVPVVSYTREQKARLVGWQINFNEWCYKEKYGFPKLENLKALGQTIPFTEPPAYWVAQQQAEEKKEIPTPVAEVENAINLPSREGIREYAKTQGIPLHMSQEEMILRHHLQQESIEDLRTPIPIPIPRSVTPQAAMMEMEATPSGSDSDSDLSVTPAVGSMHVQ